MECQQDDLQVLILPLLSIHITSNATPSHAMFKIKVFLVMVDLFFLQSINILKAHGKSTKESYLLNGYALNSGRAAQGMPTKQTPARTACLDFNIQYPFCF